MEKPYISINNHLFFGAYGACGATFTKLHMRWQLFDLLTVQNLFRIKMILLNRVHTNYNSAIFTERESLSSFFHFAQSAAIWIRMIVL